MALVLGLALMGCATTTVGTDLTLNGGWVSNERRAEEIRFNNGHVEYFDFGISIMRGTSTTSANTTTIRFTDFYGGLLSIIFETARIPIDFPSSWFTQSQMITVVENGLGDMGFPIEDIPDFLDFISGMFDELFTTQIETSEASGNTLTLTLFGYTETFTRI
jgi:hypothetical protein